jgi:hypothetical protein
MGGKEKSFLVTPDICSTEPTQTLSPENVNVAAKFSKSVPLGTITAIVWSV